MLNLKSKSYHTVERMNERLVELPLSEGLINQLALKALGYVKNVTKCDTAAQLAQFDARYIRYGRDGKYSQGNELWAVIRFSPTTRDFRVITIMLRDSHQKTEKLNVDKIIRHG